MTRAPYRLGEVLSWREDGKLRSGSVVSFTAGRQRQVLSLRMADDSVRVVTVDLRQDGRVISGALVAGRAA